MFVKVITLEFSSTYGGFEDSLLEEFLKDKELLSLQDHFFIRNNIPYLSLVIQYSPLRQERDHRLAPRGKREESWRSALTESDMGLFNLLRNWRTKRASKEGCPPYVLCTNRQLVEIVKIRPQSSADLLKIEGFGSSRIKKYGDEILEITKLILENEEREIIGAENGIGKTNVHSEEPTK